MRPRGGEQGFTLIEMIVVLVVLALVGLVVVSHGPMRSASLELRLAARTLQASLRTARAEAVAGGHDVRFTLDPAGRSYGVAGGGRHLLPARLAMPERPVLVTFHADGSASGGEIALSEAGQTLVLHVDWLSGAVGVSTAPAP